MSNDLSVCRLTLFRASRFFDMELNQQIQEFIDKEKLSAKFTRESVLRLERNA